MHFQAKDHTKYLPSIRFGWAPNEYELGSHCLQIGTLGVPFKNIDSSVNGCQALREMTRRHQEGDSQLLIFKSHIVEYAILGMLVL